MALPKSILKLSDELSALPGIGPRSAKRVALYLALKNRGLARKLGGSITDVVDSIQSCEICNNVSNEETCDICLSTNRDLTTLVIVEDAIDLDNIETTGTYKGRFHVLGGLISPVNGIGPDDLAINLLMNRLKSDDAIAEIIFALNPTIEGNATSLYIKSEIENMDREIVFTRLATGIPAGGDIEFASSQTLTDSLVSRTVL